jgi:hypothetical protein
MLELTIRIQERRKSLAEREASRTTDLDELEGHRRMTPESNVTGWPAARPGEATGC